MTGSPRALRRAKTWTAGAGAAAAPATGGLDASGTSAQSRTQGS